MSFVSLLPYLTLLVGIAAIVQTLAQAVLGLRAKNRARRALAASKAVDQSLRDLAERFSQPTLADVDVREAAKTIVVSLKKSNMTEGDLRRISQGLHQPNRFSEQRFIADLLDA